MEASRREELERGLLDVAFGAIQLLEEQEAGAPFGEDVRERVLRAPLLDHRKTDEIRRLEKTQIEHDRLDR